jgi:hypothetical protein
MTEKGEAVARGITTWPQNSASPVLTLEAIVVSSEPKCGEDRETAAQARRITSPSNSPIVRESNCRCAERRTAAEGRRPRCADEPRKAVLGFSASAVKGAALEAGTVQRAVLDNTYDFTCFRKGESLPLEMLANQLQTGRQARHEVPFSEHLIRPRVLRSGRHYYGTLPS